MKWMISCLALIAACCGAQANAQAPSAGAPIVAGVSFTLQSATLQEAREINVWTPPAYERTTDRYMVVYLLDGGRDQDFPHIAGLAQLGALSETFGPFILVGVRTGVRQNELTPVPEDARHAREFPKSGGDRQFQDYLRRDVIPFVEQHFRTGPRRALVGESLAGLFVIDTFLHEPALFNDYVSISPSLWWDEQAPALTASRFLADRSRPRTRLYLAIANEGGAMQAGMDALLAALRQAPQGTLEWTYADRSATETHATILHPAALEAFRWLYGRPEPNYGPTPRYYLKPADRGN